MTEKFETCMLTSYYLPCFFITVKQLHREFLRAGADVMQAFTFYASDDKLENRGNKTASVCA